CMQGIQIPRTF
nr:immunoglobulin light chain junction region [Macaca mulatta]